MEFSAREIVFSQVSNCIGSGLFDLLNPQNKMTPKNSSTNLFMTI